MLRWSARTGSACGHALMSSADVELGFDLGRQLGDVDHVGPGSCAADLPRPPADRSGPAELDRWSSGAAPCQESPGLAGQEAD